jgi:hypothetical protein
VVRRLVDSVHEAAKQALALEALLETEGWELHKK